MLYNMYIYNRRGKCLYYREWNRPLNTLSDDPLEERKLVFGFIFSLQDLVAKMAPSTTNNINKNETTPTALHMVKAKTFTLHHFQTLSGLIFVINSAPHVSG